MSLSDQQNEVTKEIELNTTDSDCSGTGTSIQQCEDKTEIIEETNNEEVTCDTTIEWASDLPDTPDKSAEGSDNEAKTPESKDTETSPKYYRGCFTAARQKPAVLNIKIPRDTDDETSRDPLQDTTITSPVEDEIERNMLNVSLKSRNIVDRKDLDHIIGGIAKELIAIKHRSGFMPRYRCSGTKLSGRNIWIKCPDTDSFEFYKKTIKSLPGPNPTHGGYYVRGTGDPPLFRKYRAWIPEELMDTLDHIPDFMAMETDDTINPDSIKIVGSSPSSSNGYMIYFEVTGTAENYIRSFPSGLMCGAHKLKFALVNEAYKQKPRTPVRTCGSSVDNWRNAEICRPGGNSDTSSDDTTSSSPQTPPIFYKPDKSPFLSTVDEEGGHCGYKFHNHDNHDRFNRRYSAP